MTIREVLGAIARRWYVSLAVIAVAALLLIVFARDGGIYSTKTVVTFYAPYKSSLTYSNGATDASVIAFAGTIATELNNGKPPERYSMDEAPYYGAGVREGVLIGLPSEGNQWYSSYTRAEIDIQIVGPSEQWVADKQEQLVANVLTTAQQQQNGLSEEARISATVIPLTLRIDRIVPNRTAQIGAVGAMGLAALIVAAWGSVAWDRRRRRRTSTRGLAAVESRQARRAISHREGATDR